MVKIEINAMQVQNYGAGIIALTLIFWGILYTIKNIVPTVKQQNILLGKLCENDNYNAEIIRNNTEAILELSKSNDNVAEALKILDITSQSQMALFKQLQEQIVRHDKRAERLEIEVIKVSERIDFLTMQK